MSGQARLAPSPPLPLFSDHLLGEIVSLGAVGVKTRVCDWPMVMSGFEPGSSSLKSSS